MFVKPNFDFDRKYMQIHEDKGGIGTFFRISIVYPGTW